MCVINDFLVYRHGIQLGKRVVVLRNRVKQGGAIIELLVCFLPYFG